jgi:hypothetical protein
MRPATGKITVMENFRDFQLGPDPFGRTWHVLFKYLQTGISIRHSDSVDVCFLLESGDEKLKRVIVLNHADLLAYTKRTGRQLTDTWCSRLAVCRLKYAVETAEDIDKDFLHVTPREIEEYDGQVKKWEEEWVKTHAA